MREHKDFFVHDTATVDEGALIGAETKIWHYTHVMSRAKIGTGCIIGQNVFIGDEVVLGNGCKVQNNVSLYTGIVCEDDVFLGPSSVFTNVVNPRAFIERKDEFRRTTIHRGASIGANATIVCGVTIGEYAFVAAGAVVTESVDAYALVMGVPAKWVAYVSRVGEKLHFDPTTNIAICPSSGERYQLRKGKVTLIV